MRPIKFRVWSEKEKSYMFRIRLDETGPHVDRDYALGYKPMVWEQFTGLHDKNGKEIYEGDILQWKILEPIEKKHDLLMTTPVTFSKGGFVPFTDPAYDVSPEECEVIGDIHENPELLKPKAK